MLARRFALAVGLLLAVVASQVPEFVQQYRQRLGGAAGELKRIVAQFDEEARSQALDRRQGIERLKSSPDVLARSRGADLEETVEREQRLEAQDNAFADAGPVSRYWVFIERLDPRIAADAYVIYQPAVPLSAPGFVAAAAGLVVGWGGTRLIGAPFRRRRAVPA